MYLSKVEVTGFRGIGSIVLQCHPGVNVLIGENNTCKTALLDAIRLCLGFSFERRDLYVQHEDFHVGADGARSTAIDFVLTFAEPTQREQGIFVEMLGLQPDGTVTMSLHVQYSDTGDRIRRRVWGGANEGQEIPSDLLQLFYFTHLGALRDATRDLSPSRANRLSQLFLKLVSVESERKEYASFINRQIRGADKWGTLLESAKLKVKNHLGQMLLQGQDNDISIEFIDTTFRQIVEGLRMYIPRGAPVSENKEDSVEEPLESSRFEISQNSLGFNNLLYIATVLGDLIERREREPDSFISLLIEEPEAHLHPHWQNTLFQYIQYIERRNIQVFITSHSPTITAKSPIDSVIVMTGALGNIVSTPLRSLELPETEKKYLQRFLDVTKCQLFFARRVILVEGISEALLMPIFAKAMGPEFDLDKNALEVVNIGGVAFKPFALLFNNGDTVKRLPVRCSIVTDDDRVINSTPSARAARALELSGGNVKVFWAQMTFEFELYKANEPLVTQVYSELHPKTDMKFEGKLDERAAEFVRRLRQNDDKAVLAQLLAEKLSDPGVSKNLVVPKYIQNALKWAVAGDVA